jgi:formylglycine-generating enzyme required for sulfatase activity
LFVRLPTEDEWVCLAGKATKLTPKGEKERYPWDPLPNGDVTDPTDEAGQKAILARANTTESGIGGTSPVAMYPLGESKPFRLWDLAGNVWEWTDSWCDKAQSGRVVRGGSWDYSQRDARPSFRYRYRPLFSNHFIGFRLVSPISSLVTS